MGPDITDIDNQVTAVATAAALAYAETFIDCFVQGNAFAAVSVSAFVSARAEAYAEAVSSIFADSDVCPNCTVVTEAIVRTSRNIIAEAAAETRSEVLPSQILPLKGTIQKGLSVQPCDMYFPSRGLPLCMVFMLRTHNVFLLWVDKHGHPTAALCGYRWKSLALRTEVSTSDQPLRPLRLSVMLWRPHLQALPAQSGPAHRTAAVLILTTWRRCV